MLGEYSASACQHAHLSLVMSIVFSTIHGRLKLTEVSVAQLYDLIVRIIAGVVQLVQLAVGCVVKPRRLALPTTRQPVTDAAVDTPSSNLTERAHVSRNVIRILCLIISCVSS